MKNTNKLFLSFLGLTVVLTSCQEQPKKENPATVAGQAEQIIYEAPKQIISLEEADSLYVNYKDRRATNIVQMEAEYQEDGKPFVPTQFISFDIDSLKTYIAYVEQEAKSGGTKVDSLRVYLGNYGNQKKGWKKKRRNTIFFVPAAKAEGAYGGIYIGTDGKAKLISSFFKSNNNKKQGNRSEASILPNFKTHFMQGGTSLIMNEGGLSPPPETDF